MTTRSAEPLARVMIVDDETPLLRALARILGEQRYEVETFENPADALARAPTGNFDVALLDIRMQGMTGIELLKHLKNVVPDLEVVMMTAHGTVQDAFQAVRHGAFNFLRKPFENVKEEIGLAIGQALERRRLRDRNRYLEQRVSPEDRFDDIVGRSAAMRPVFELISAAAPSQSTILVLGETGVGKDMVARAIHARSRRAHKPYVAVNCGALAETVLDAELFGSKVGGFTGATARAGLWASADGGTIFLDEVGEMSLAMQTKLLRVLESGELKAVGADDTRVVDVRVIAATHVDLDKAVAEGRFRKDLLGRLRVFRINVPPLRARPEDVPLIAHGFLKQFAAREKKEIRGISPELVEVLVQYQWPENVRHLRNVIESAVVMCQGEELTVADCRMSSLADFIKPTLPAPARTSARPSSGVDAALYDMPFAEAKTRAINVFERDYVVHVLDVAGGNLTKAAQLANMDRTNFRRVLKRSGLRDSEEETGDFTA